MKWAAPNIQLFKKAFTIVELLVVIVVLGILAGITVVGYGAWQTRLTQSTVQNDLKQAAAALEQAKNFGSRLPTAVPSTFKSSNNVAVAGGWSSTGSSFCLQAVSTKTAGISYYIDGLSKTPVAGNCMASNGMVAWWPMDGNARDVSGNDNNGIVTGATLTTDKNGNENEAYLFSAKSDLIDIANIANDDISISVWYKYNGNGGTWNTILCRDGSPYHALLVSTAAEIGFYNSGWVSSGSALSVGNWYHLTVVKSGSNSKIYVNGSKVQDSSASFSNATYPFSRIGNFSGSTQGALGVIDDVRAYSRVLSDNEVLDLYNSGPQ